MILLSDVSKKFGAQTALHNITFKTKEGEIIGLLGPNGAGKTTTMRLILGLLSPTSGSVKVFGHNPTTTRLKVVSKVGYLPENNPLYPDMTVFEYLTFIARVKNENNLRSIITSVSLDEVLDRKIEDISRGYKQRVGLAGALCGNPDILILDEPTSGLDPVEQENIRKLIFKIKKNKTIIFSTHILSEVEAIASRIIIIFQGKIAYDGSTPKGKGAVEKLFKKVVSSHLL